MAPRGVSKRRQEGFSGQVSHALTGLPLWPGVVQESFVVRLACPGEAPSDRALDRPSIIREAREQACRQTERCHDPPPVHAKPF